MNTDKHTCQHIQLLLRQWDLTNPRINKKDSHMYYGKRTYFDDG